MKIINEIKTKTEEFEKFHKLLMDSAPENYKPFYFPVRYFGKDPDTLAIGKRYTGDNTKLKYSWTQEHARLSFEEAKERLKKGGNVGIAARKDDCLHIIDIDDFDYLNQLPNTGLVCISRRRTGRHHFSWMKPEDKHNITTEYGEIRSCEQYVVCAGSFVPTSKDDILEDVKNSKITDEQLNKILNDVNMGLYTVHPNSEPPCWMKNIEIPKFFKEQLNKDKQNVKIQEKSKNDDLILPKNHSALYSLKVSDIVETMPKSRMGHPLHSSDTNANWSITDDGSLGQCWRHLVSLNAIQFLCVKAGYKTCKEAGVGHKGSSPSEIRGDIRAIWEAWYEAKKCGLIPNDDPIPIKAMHYIGKKHKLIDFEEFTTLPNRIYKKIIEIVESEY